LDVVSCLFTSNSISEIVKVISAHPSLIILFNFGAFAREIWKQISLFGFVVFVCCPTWEPLKGVSLSLLTVSFVSVFRQITIFVKFGQQTYTTYFYSLHPKNTTKPGRSIVDTLYRLLKRAYDCSLESVMIDAECPSKKCIMKQAE
jgi:hypothetical protein